MVGRTAFALYAGERGDLAAIARALGASAEEQAELVEWATDTVLVSEGEGGVRVSVASAELLEAGMASELERLRRAAGEVDTLEALAHRGMAQLYFCCGRDRLLEGPVSELNKDTIEWLSNGVPNAIKRETIRVVGYASTPGDCRANRALSARRARAVVRQLRRAGYRKVEVEWCGEVGPGLRTCPRGRPRAPGASPLPGTGGSTRFAGRPSAGGRVCGVR